MKKFVVYFLLPRKKEQKIRKWNVFIFSFKVISFCLFIYKENIFLFKYNIFQIYFFKF